MLMICGFSVYVNAQSKRSREDRSALGTPRLICKPPKLNISGVRQAIVTFGPADTSDPSLDAFADMYPGISNVIGRVLSTYGDEIEDMQRSVLADAKSGIEVVDVSLFYPSKTCRGNYVNQTTFTGPINITSCHGYWDRSVGE